MALDYASVGEIRMFAMPGAPSGWAPLDGRTMPQSSIPWWPYLIGSAFGPATGSISLPDMRGRAPMGAPGGGTRQGLATGEETVTLTPGQMPPHAHGIIAGPGVPVVPAAENFLGPVQDNGTSKAFPIYGNGVPTVPLATPTIAETGGGGGHENRQPLLAINFSMCLRGGYPGFDYSEPEDDSCLGEIRLFAFTALPSNYRPCDGSSLQIRDYTDLYALIGTIYGGDGRSTFAVPNMSGRVPVGAGQGPGLSPYALGAAAGCEAADVGPWQIPAHGHGASVSDAPAISTTPVNGVTLADAAPNSLYETAGAALPTLVPLDTGSVVTTGGSQSHPNIQPSLGLQFAICVRGELPTFV